MIDRDYPDPAERAELDQREEFIVALLGRYIERRENGAPPLTHDLLAAAAEFGGRTVDELRTVVAFYEAMRTRETASS